MIMMRSILITAVLGILVGAPAVYVLNAPAQQRPAAARLGSRWHQFRGGDHARGLADMFVDGILGGECRLGGSRS